MTNAHTKALEALTEQMRKVRYDLLSGMAGNPYGAGGTQEHVLTELRTPEQAAADVRLRALTVALSVCLKQIEAYLGIDPG